MVAGHLSYTVEDPRFVRHMPSLVMALRNDELRTHSSGFCLPLLKTFFTVSIQDGSYADITKEYYSFTFTAKSSSEEYLKTHLAEIPETMRFF